MSPSVKKRPKHRVVFKVQDEETQDKIRQPVSKAIHQNRLKMVLKNLSLLRLLKNSNPRNQELYNLAKRCWNSWLRVPKVLLISSGNKAVSDKADQNTKEPQKARCSKKKLDSKKLKSVGKPKELKSKVWLGVRNKAQQSLVAVPEREEQMESEVPQTSGGHGLTTCPGARGRQIPTGDSQVVFLKNHQQRTPMGDMEQLEAADRWVWYEGLPTRIHLPGPRVMCRSSTLRWIKRCCTRFCSASLELPMCHLYKVSARRWADGSRSVSRGQRSCYHLKGKVGWENLEEKK
uniref:TP53 target 5 n=2 Tax=Rousettus aegyptiacus TaxID=9407 RepID=A0A7J8DM10_ROUAE|nr:TP53 target 5 [Rousettus aegyptiacus]